MADLSAFGWQLIKPILLTVLPRDIHQVLTVPGHIPIHLPHKVSYPLKAYQI
jgi:hypothetical protein